MIHTIERTLLCMIAIALFVLAAVIYRPALFGVEPRSSEAATTTAPKDHPTESGFTAPSAGPYTGAEGARSTESATAASTTPAPHDHHLLLCTDPQGLSIIHHGGRVAMAADRQGHFTLYALPNPKTGLPTTDSYALLDDCTPNGDYANVASVQVAAHRIGPAGLPIKWLLDRAQGPHVARRTTVEGEALVTGYRFVNGVGLTQLLTLTPQGALHVSYTLKNTSATTHTVALRSLLTPVAANTDQDVLFEVLSGNRGATRGAKSITVRRDCVIPSGTSRLQQPPRAVWVPRRGAASDASALWRPAGTGPRPSAVAFAGYYRLLDTPFYYDKDAHWPLPPNAAMAVYWAPVTLAPEVRIVLSESYGQPPQPPRGIERGGATTRGGGGGGS